MEREEEGLVVVRGRAEIDMRQPFRSVKEAVMLFGEKVLAGEVYANKLKEIQTNKNGNRQSSRFGEVKVELEETKQSLQKAKEEGKVMAYCLNTLKQELEHTKKELSWLKQREISSNQPPLDPEIEDLKFIENTNKIDQLHQNEEDDDDGRGFGNYLQKKRSVKFASPPSLAHVISVTKDVGEPANEKKAKRKALIPMIAALFFKKGSRRTK